MHGFRLTAIVLLCIAAACSRGRKYELRGQVVAVDESRQELTVKHEDIRGFMPGMTMPFRVRGGRVGDRQPGDLIRATLVVEDTQAYLTDIVPDGHAPLAGSPPARPAVPILREGEEVPDAAFVDQDGAARTFAAWRGRIVVVTFVYTRCPLPDFCPALDRRFAALQQAILTTPKLSDRVRLLSVSFDPRFDTPAVLKTHARRAGADPAVWTFATGAEQEVERFAARFGVSLMKEDASGQEIVHNLRTAVVDPRGRLARTVGGADWTAGDLLATIGTLSAIR